jgi:hypothetical protein
MPPDQLNVINTVIGQESVDSLLEKAKAAPQAAAADAIYITAIKKMLDQKQWDRALSVVTDIHDEGLST